MSDGSGGSDAGAARVRTPREIIEIYWEEIWNKGNVELIREICADPILRHDVGRVTCLSHEEQIARVRQGVDQMAPHFTHEVLIADERHVTSVWNMTSGRDPELKICSIETFRAENGRFVACWNAPYAKGLWGRVGDAAEGADSGPPEPVETVEQIDARWIERMFAAAGVAVPHVALVSKVEPIGKGTSCAVYRLHLAYNVEGSRGAPRTLIAKLPSPDRDHAARIGAVVDYGREVAAYPYLGAGPSARMARCYYAARHAGGGFTLILEDVGEDARPGDQVAGCGVAEAELVVRELAALHAAHWKSDALEALDWPQRIARDAGMIAAVYRQGATELGAGLCRDWDADDLALIDGVAPLVERWFAAEPHETLIHGEARVDNILFETVQGVASRACLIDLQQVGIGDPLRDIAYFLGGSLDPVDRRACERLLVEAHAAVIRAVDPGYDAGAAWAAYRANAIAGLVYTVAASTVVAPSDDNERLLMSLLTRNLAMVRDLDGIAAAKARAGL